MSDTVETSGVAVNTDRELWREPSMPPCAALPSLPVRMPLPQNAASSIETMVDFIDAALSPSTSRAEK